jgi:hypothetical protein
MLALLPETLYRLCANVLLERLLRIKMLPRISLSWTELQMDTSPKQRQTRNFMSSS